MSFEIGLGKRLGENSPPNTPPKKACLERPGICFTPPKNPTRTPEKVAKLSPTLLAPKEDLIVNRSPLILTQLKKAPPVYTQYEWGILRDEIKKYPVAAKVQCVTLNVLAAMALNEETEGGVWYKQGTLLDKEIAFPNSFVAIWKNKSLHVYISTHHEIGRGSVGKVSDVFRVVFQNKKCLCFEEGTVVSHLSSIVSTNQESLDSIRTRLHKRLQTTFLLENLEGIVPFYDVCQYVNGNNIEKTRIFYKKCETNLQMKIDAWVDMPVTEAEEFERFKKIANDLGKALHHFHKRRLMHRDVKCENILYDKGSVLLTDFDLCDKIGTGIAAGTLEYAAPEILAEVLKGTGYKEYFNLPETPSFTEATDLYSLGVVLHEVYYGQKPWLHEKIVEYQMATHDPEEKKSINAYMDVIKSILTMQAASTSIILGKRKRLKQKLSSPATPDELIDRLLSMNPSDRPSAEEVAAFGGPTKINVRRALFKKE